MNSSQRGYSVTVYERKALGGKARSIPVPNSGATPPPAEHGFRFFPGLNLNRNVTDTMRRVPFPGNANGTWDNLTRATSYLHSGLGRHDLTIPLPFPLPPIPNPITPKAFIDSVATVFETLFRLPPWEAVYAAQKLAVYVTSSTERKLGQWESMTWEDYIGANRKSAEYNRYLADGIIRNLAASKSKDASAHSIGLVGEASVWSILLLGNDSDNKGFDRVLNGPTSSQWLDPWADYLRGQGVTFRVGQALARLTPNGKHVQSATVVNGSGVPQQVTADWYVSAIPCEKLGRGAHVRRTRGRPATGQHRPAAHRVDERADVLPQGASRRHQGPRQLRRLRMGDHVDQRGTVLEEEFERITATAPSKSVCQRSSPDLEPPALHIRRSARDCTPQEIAVEAWAQIKAHLNDTDKVVDDDMLHSRFLDPAIIDSGTPNVRNDEPLFIQDPGSWNRRPAAVTGIDNLFLAGEWIKTDQNVTTMEDANEGGRYAANGVLQASGHNGDMVKIVIFPGAVVGAFQACDRARYRAGLPHALDIVDTRWPTRR